MVCWLLVKQADPSSDTCKLYPRVPRLESLPEYQHSWLRFVLGFSDCRWRIARAERDGTRAETRFRLSLKRRSPFKSVGVSVQSTAGSRGVRISLSNAGYTTFRGRVRVLATHSIRQFPLHFPSRASPCATNFRTSSSTKWNPNISIVPRTFSFFYLDKKVEIRKTDSGTSCSK